MTPHVDKVAAVVRKHATTIGGFCLCGFDCTPETIDNHAKHVAQAAIDALGVAMDYRVVRPSLDNPSQEVCVSAKDLDHAESLLALYNGSPRPVKMHLEARLASPWNTEAKP